MNLADLGKKLLSLGAPVIGTALGGPLGGAAAKVLADKLGASSPEPDAIAEKLDTMPAPLVAERLSESEAEWADAVKAQAELAKVQVAEVNATMRHEAEQRAKTPNGWWGHWRERLANLLVIECPVWVAAIVVAIFWGYANEVMMLSPLIMAWWGARFGVLGVSVATGSLERRTAMTGQTAGGLISTAVKAIRGQ